MASASTSTASTATSGKLILVAKDGSLTDKFTKVNGKDLVLGSDKSCHIRMKTGNVLPRHARITLDSMGNVFLKLIGAEDGKELRPEHTIVLNDHQTIKDREPVRLYHTDRFRIGNATFCYETLDKSPDKSPEKPTDKPAEKALEKALEKPSEKSLENPLRRQSLGATSPGRADDSLFKKPESRSPKPSPASGKALSPQAVSTAALSGDSERTLNMAPVNLFPSPASTATVPAPASTPAPTPATATTVTPTPAPAPATEIPSPNATTEGEFTTEPAPAAVEEAAPSPSSPLLTQKVDNDIPAASEPQTAPLPETIVAAEPTAVAYEKYHDQDDDNVSGSASPRKPAPRRRSGALGAPMIEEVSSPSSIVAQVAKIGRSSANAESKWNKLIEVTGPRRHKSKETSRPSEKSKSPLVPSRSNKKKPIKAEVDSAAKKTEAQHVSEDLVDDHADESEDKPLLTEEKPPKSEKMDALQLEALMRNVAIEGGQPKRVEGSRDPYSAWYRRMVPKNEKRETKPPKNLYDSPKRRHSTTSSSSVKRKRTAEENESPEDKPNKRRRVTEPALGTSSSMGDSEEKPSANPKDSKEAHLMDEGSSSDDPAFLKLKAKKAKLAADKVVSSSNLVLRIAEAAVLPSRELRLFENLNYRAFPATDKKSRVKHEPNASKQPAKKSTE